MTNSDEDENETTGVKVTTAGLEYLLDQWRRWAVDELERFGVYSSNQGEAFLNAELRQALTLLFAAARAKAVPR